jgi:formylglycine-generating enzyme required for sulfatase activity
MGSTNGYTDEQPVHQVTVSAFYMDSTEVTQADYDSLMGVNPSYFTGDSLRPVEQVTWFDAVL